MSPTQKPGDQVDQYVVEVCLTDGTRLRGDPGHRSSISGRLYQLDQRLSTDGFVAITEQMVIRGSDVRYVRMLKADDSSSAGLVDTIKDKIGGGGSRMSYDEPTTPGTAGAHQPHQGGRQRSQQGFMDEYLGYGRRPFAETKPFFLTSEFLALVLAAIGVCIAMATSDLLDAHHGWTLITALAIGYMVSRGLAKSGSRDPNPEQRYRD